MDHDLKVLWTSGVVPPEGKLKKNKMTSTNLFLVFFLLIVPPFVISIGRPRSALYPPWAHYHQVWLDGQPDAQGVLRFVKLMVSMVSIMCRWPRPWPTTSC